MIICVTGPMAAGKNAAASILEKKGFPQVDADVLGHIAVENCKEKILEAFSSLAQEKGIQLVSEDGKIIRRNLGALIFADPKLIKKQEDIVYPEINRLFDQFLEENKGKDVVINATVLYKVPLIHKVDVVLFVDCPIIKRFFRAKKRDGIKAKYILARFKAQRNLFTKYKNTVADTRRVWNTGSFSNLERKIDSFLASLYC